MTSSFFFLQADKTDKNRRVIEEIEKWSEEAKSQAYIINRPLGDNKYVYDHSEAIVVLIPQHKLSFVDFSGNSDSFESFVNDFIEDLGSISDKYRYKDSIGRPRTWSNDLVARYEDGNDLDFENFLAATFIGDPARQRRAELLISLLTGSINDIVRVRADLPDNLLEKVKRKILLFDGDQTRFVYEKSNKAVVRIQGLSGTGKTELLLHKLKELYIDEPDSRIAMTCHNKILADSLRKRIPDFFNFMKVEQQIMWNERLWCVHAWGSQNDRHSGVYSYICNYYGIPFQRWSMMSSFESVCSDALAVIKTISDRKHAFDYILIDESQDFPESFFSLCQEVTRNVVYIAGDIFQGIFDESITASISPDFLLSKCYRTDPRTLMFAHALGMGLFEEHKLRWLEDEEWKACGYIVDKLNGDSVYHLKREPIRRFEDIDRENFNCVEIITTEGEFLQAAQNSIIKIIQDISRDNPTVTPNDIGVIFLDSNKEIYTLSDMLEQVIPRRFGWRINKAYESKQRIQDTLFVSNKNNVKGLEFPFVVCVTAFINRSYAYRNSLYMTLTRSFLKSYIVMSGRLNQAMLGNITRGLGEINRLGYIEVEQPTPEEKERIKTTIQQLGKNVSYYDFVQNVFDELKVKREYRSKLLEVLKQTVGEDFDKEYVKGVVDFNYRAMLRGVS